MALTTKRKLPRFVLVLVTTCCSLLIAACAGGPSPFAASGPCNPGVCKADVTVVSTAGSCVVSVDPPTLYVLAPANIEWTIETDGYQFQDNGIVINPPNGSDFTHQPGSGKKFILHDKHSILGPIKYTVTVMPDSGGSACVLDPIIYNQ